MTDNKYPDKKPLPELMMASYHEAIGWNACVDAMRAAEAAERVYLVNTGEIRNGLELYERHDSPVPLADFEVLYTVPQPKCLTCNDHGMIGGLLPGDGGYDGQPCPDCSSDGLAVAQVAPKPVAYRHLHEDGWEYYDAPTGSDCQGCEPLYTVAPQPDAPQGENRETFEQMFRSIYPKASSAGALELGEDGFYLELETRLALRMWNAALATLPQEAAPHQVDKSANMQGQSVDKSLNLQGSEAAPASQDAEDVSIKALRRAKADLIHQRRFGPDTHGHWRNAACYVEGDIEETLTAIDAARAQAKEGDGNVL